MVDQRKQSVSIRLGSGDVRNVKRMAKRLGVRDSDIIRFAIKSMLGRMAPLCGTSVAGRNLVPLLIESGDELIRHFELDSYRLENIINEDSGEECRVDREDIALLAMSGLRDQYLLMRMQDVKWASSDGSAAAHTLKNYLYEKYVQSRTEERQVEGKQIEAKPAIDRSAAA
jgi:hypothetical protein